MSVGVFCFHNDKEIPLRLLTRRNFYNRKYSKREHHLDETHEIEYNSIKIYDYAYCIAMDSMGNGFCIGGMIILW